MSSDPIDDDDDLTPAQKHARDLQKWEQGMTMLSQNLPIQWMGLFRRSQELGFSEMQAMELVKTYIISQGSGDKKAP